MACDVSPVAMFVIEWTVCKKFLHIQNLTANPLRWSIERWKITTNMGQGHPNGKRQSNIQRAARNLCVGALVSGCEIFCKPPICTPRAQIHDMYSGQRSLCVFWSKAPDLMRVRPYAGPMCTTLGVQGPRSPQTPRAIKILDFLKTQIVLNYV